MSVTTRSDVTVDLHKAAARDTDVAIHARVSTLGGEGRYAEATERDEGLINYLMRERHGSPFEHNSMTFYVEAPIFVFREWQRHRAGVSYNEESGRYRELKPVFYMPGTDRKLVQVGKPGAYTFEQGDLAQLGAAHSISRRAYEVAWNSYQMMLQEGIAREVARMVLPVGIYSSMYVTFNARSLMHFLSLRTHSEDAFWKSHPQREIEMCGELLEEHFARLMPVTHEAFVRHGRVAP
jgi:thymidylate synthase (FAD)